MIDFKKLLSICGVICFTAVNAKAQDLKKPVDYLNHINVQYSNIAKEYWDYTRAIGHGKRAKLVEKRRVDLLKAITEAKREIAKMPPVNKSTVLRDSIVAYFRFSYNMVNEDYAKIVNMEEVAEQSYDAMEALMLAKDLAREKQAVASDMVSDQIDRFAAENKIKLVESESKLGKKMRIAGKVFEYYNKVYLLFFKSNKQDTYLSEALKKGDINGIEQNRNSLLNYSKEGIEKLKEFIRYEGDETLSTACRQVLNYYADEAENKVPVMIEYFTAKDKFEKIKTTFDKIRTSDRTQQNIDTYNKAINEMNAASTKYNEISKKLNETGNKLLDNWNKKSDAFLDTHVP